MNRMQDRNVSTDSTLSDVSTSSVVSTFSMVSGIANTTELTELVKENVCKLMNRRGYTITMEESDTVLAVNKQGSKLVAYFIEHGKVTIGIIYKIIEITKSMSKNVLIIYNKSLTTDAKQAVLINNVFNFETFSYDEMSFDLIDESDYCEHKVYTGPPLKETNKFPKILSTDIVMRYYGIKPGSIVVINERDGCTILRKCV